MMSRSRENAQRKALTHASSSTRRRQYCDWRDAPDRNGPPEASSILSVAVMVLAVLIPCAVHAIQLPQSRRILLGYELLCEITIAAGVVWHLMSRNHSPTRKIALAALSFSLLSLSLAPVTQFSRFTFFGQFNPFYCFSLGSLCLVFGALAKASRDDKFFWTSVSALALVFYGIQHRYLLVPTASVTPDVEFVVFSRAYSAICAFGVALAVLHSLRTLDKLEFALASAVLLMFALDFAARHSFIAPPHETTSLAQCLWVSTVAELCAAFFLHRPKAPVNGDSKRLPTAEWMSVRVIFGMFLFFANVVLLVSIIVTDILSFNSAPHVRILLFLLVARWSASNWLALKISTDMRCVLDLMPSSETVNETGQVLPTAIGSPIGGRTLMAEVDGMIGRYNILVKNANALVANLDERNEAIVVQAQQVAHDIRSPLAAFNVVLPDLDVLPEDTRVMLRNAIFRIQDIAGTLLQSGEKRDLGENQREFADVVMLSSLADSVVSEKRVQYRDKLYVRIENSNMANS